MEQGRDKRPKDSAYNLEKKASKNPSRLWEGLALPMLSTPAAVVESPRAYGVFKALHAFSHRGCFWL